MGCGLGSLSLEVVVVLHTGIFPLVFLEVAVEGARIKRSTLSRTANWCQVSPPSGTLSIFYLQFRKTPSLT